MSFTDLTPMTSGSSSSSIDSDSSMNDRQQRKLQNISHFNSLLEELEFGSSPAQEEKYLDVEDVPDTYDEDVVEVEEEEEEEDTDIKYPYERKDVFVDLKERIEQRLKDSGDEELEKRAQEINFLLKTKQAEWKAEEKLERELSRAKTFTDGSIFTCVMCSKAFPDSEQLQKHTEQMHNLQFRCNLCGKGYKHKKNLDTHMKLHSQELKCDQCSLVFRSQTTLFTHQNKYHSDPFAFQKKCPKCKKNFSEKVFKRHLYSCENKEKYAARKKEMKAQSTPTSPALSTISCASFNSYQPGPSSFRSPLASPIVSYRDKSCQVCGETFASRQSMLRHVGRKHPEAKDDPNVTAVRYVSTESPTHQYACVDCGKRLVTRAALTTHRARAHAVPEEHQRHECPACQKTYTVAQDLAKHIQRVHGEPKETTTRQMSILEELPELPDHIF